MHCRTHGHQKIAGKCSEQNIAGSNMLRVDVPATDKQQPFTRFYSSAAVYAIHPVDESTASSMAGKLQQATITIWDMSELMKGKMTELPVGGEDDDDDEDLDDLPY